MMARMVTTLGKATYKGIKMKTLALLSLLLTPLSLSAQQNVKLVNRSVAEFNSSPAEQTKESWSQPFAPDDDTIVLLSLIHI